MARESAWYWNQKRSSSSSNDETPLRSGGKTVGLVTTAAAYALWVWTSEWVSPQVQDRESWFMQPHSRQEESSPLEVFTKLKPSPTGHQHSSCRIPDWVHSALHCSNSRSTLPPHHVPWRPTLPCHWSLAKASFLQSLGRLTSHYHTCRSFASLKTQLKWQLLFRKSLEMWYLSLSTLLGTF